MFSTFECGAGHWGAMSEPEALRVTNPKGSMDMDASLWSELPFEMVGHILSFLLLPDVCKNRSVCQKWNQLIRSDEFAALHGQHARRCRGPSVIPMSFRCRGPPIREYIEWDWCCLDLGARRWYTFDEDDDNIGPFVAGVQSMRGGFVCRLQLALPQPESQHLSIIVHNVKGSTKVTLPEIAGQLNPPDAPKVLMVADNTSFKIVLIKGYFRTLMQDRSKVQCDPVLHVYDSATCEWKSIVNTSWIEHDAFGIIWSVVMYQGSLYVLFLRHDFVGGEAFWRLQRYNLTGESWENVDLCTYSNHTSLVVSNDCLYLVLWCREKCSDDDMSEEWFFEVREIRTCDMTQEMVLKLSKADVIESFDIKTGSPPPFELHLLGISVIGFERSLFLMSHATGKSKLFDLVTRSWDHDLPSNPLLQVHGDTAWIGLPMNLLLPWNTDW